MGGEEEKGAKKDKGAIRRLRIKLIRKKLTDQVDPQ